VTREISGFAVPATNPDSKGRNQAAAPPPAGLAAGLPLAVGLPLTVGLPLSAGLPLTARAAMAAGSERRREDRRCDWGRTRSA
jgi:hypothetical protein